VGQIIAGVGVEAELHLLNHLLLSLAITT